MREAGRVRLRRHREAAPPRGTNLSPALRGGMVDGDSMGGDSAQGRARPIRTDFGGQVRRIPNRASPRTDARTAPGNTRLAVRGGPADRRGDAPAHAPRGRPLWRGAAKPERGADSLGGTVEVRFQEHQVDRVHRIHRDAAAHHLEPLRPARIRVLLQREPGGGSPQVEPGARAADRRSVQARDPDVQRIRRRGRGSLRRDGSRGPTTESWTQRAPPHAVARPAPSPRHQRVGPP